MSGFDRLSNLKFADREVLSQKRTKLISVNLYNRVKGIVSNLFTAPNFAAAIA